MVRIRCKTVLMVALFGLMVGAPGAPRPLAAETPERVHALTPSLVEEARRLLADRAAREQGKPSSSGLSEKALVDLGETLILAETFDGNGRTCGTCHLPEDSFGLSPAFIDILPGIDPLFIAENDPVLADLEHPPLMNGPRGLILENIDGFANPPVFRGSPHFLNMAFTAPYGLSGEFPNLRVFATGAVMQHFPKTLGRVPGVDFRLPTETELDAMEAFMRSIFLPADKNFELVNFVTTQQQRRGSDLFFGESKCGMCHNGPVLATATAALGGGNQNFNTGVVNQPINLINDPLNPGGLPLPREASGLREFSTPPLMGIAQTAPFFHDNSVATLEDAVLFYDGLEFNASPGAAVAGNIAFAAATQVDDIVAFLESLREFTFEVSPSSNFFGTQDFTVGQAGPVTVTVTNNSPDPLTIDSVDLVGPHSAEFTLSMISPTEFEVLFDPASVGPKIANLEFSTNAGNIGVRLTGVGIEPGVAPFADVPPGNPTAPFIESLFNAAAISGCGGGNFCPNDLVTRAQLAVMLVVAKGDFDVPPRGVFDDVGPTSFAAGFIEKLLADGITGGCGGGNFCPDAFVTRAQLAVMLVVASGRTPVDPPLGLFGDVPPDFFAAGFIERLNLDGIVVGCGGGNFCPNDPVTRSQVAVFLSAGLELP